MLHFTAGLIADQQYLGGGDGGGGDKKSEEWTPSLYASPFGEQFLPRHPRLTMCNESRYVYANSSEWHDEEEASVYLQR